MDFVKNRNTIKLLILNVILIFFSLLTNITNMMILWFILIGLLSLYFIVSYKEKMKKREIIISLVLGMITMISNAFMAIFVCLFGIFSCSSYYGESFSKNDVISSSKKT